MTDISLNASMRTNLLSLQQISKLQDQTQLRLSTGLKVNSAIDNPSSYYTAQSLTNRADDLSALLDAMGQGIQTIKAANEGIEKATELLDQMKAVVEQVSVEGVLPDKAYFVDAVGENGVVVSTVQELRDAIASGKETICVYGKIDLGDISTTGGLELQENQKLVGVNYFGNFKNGMEFSSISATDSVADHAMIDIKKTGCLVSDLSINYSNSAASGQVYAIKVEGADVTVNIQNLDMKTYFSTDDNNGRGGIGSWNGAITNINGNINIETEGTRGYGIFCYNQSTTNILGQARINIKTADTRGYGFFTYKQSTTNIQSGANINIETSGENGWGIYTYIDSTTNIQAKANVNIKTSGNYGIAIYTIDNSSINIFAKMNIETSQKDSYGIYNSNYNKNNTYIGSTAQIYFNTSSREFWNGYNINDGSNILEIAQGAKLAFEKNGATKWYEVKEDYKDENTSTSINNSINSDNIETKMNVSETSVWKTAQEIIEEADQEENYIILEDSEAKTYQKQFNSALSQFDMLINDSSYKGINLLKEDKLKVNFNEDKSAFLNVNGMDLTSEGLGMLTADWSTSNDVQNTLNQIMSAKDKLRSAATKLGNYYSIITERDNFTDNLINVLEEGADKLTLADMNEESANMLALQTQQQLAINSLSLASQASQGVLKLF